MNFQEKLLLSSYLIKSAGGSRIGTAIGKALIQQSKKLAPKVISKLAPKAAPKGRLGDRIRRAMGEVDSVADDIAAAPARAARGYVPPPPSIQAGAPSIPATPLISAAQTSAQAVNNSARAARGYVPPPPSIQAGAPSIPATPLISAAQTSAQAVNNPTGLALMNQGLGQVARGFQQAATTGFNATRAGVGNALSYTGRAITNNPRASAFGAGLLGAGAGMYGASRLVNGWTPPSEGQTLSSRDAYATGVANANQAARQAIENSNNPTDNPNQPAVSSPSPTSGRTPLISAPTNRLPGAPEVGQSATNFINNVPPQFMSLAGQNMPDNLLPLVGDKFRQYYNN